MAYPKEFVGQLLSKIMPVQIQQGEHEDQSVVTIETSEEIIERLRKRGLPNNVIEALTAQVFAYMAAKKKGLPLPGPVVVNPDVRDPKELKEVKEVK
jgi:hypothetical protein